MVDLERAPQDTRLGRFSWMLYDFANSAFTTIVLTFIFSVYFSRAIAPNEVVGTRTWGWAMSISAILLALSSPVLGAIADRTGRRKPWVFVFSAVCVVASLGLWWAAPTSGSENAALTMFWVLALVVVANVGFELGIVFNNAMLPGITTADRMGRLSGYAWGLGYVGGLLCLMLSLVLFVQPETPLFGLDKSAQEHIRIVAPFTAAWFVVFSIPLFLFTRDAPKQTISTGQAIKEGLASLWQTFSNARRNQNLFRFLIASLFYRDGLITIFQMGGLFAGAVYGLSFEDLLLFGILLNITSALGAFIFAHIDDRIGSKRVIIISIICLSLVTIPLLASSGQTMFYVLASIIGLFIGSIQSSSRTLAARLAPPNQESELFGLYGLAGKSTSFLGPLMMAELTAAYGHRVGMGSILIFFAIGLLLLLTVKEPGHSTDQ